MTVLYRFIHYIIYSKVLSSLLTFQSTVICFGVYVVCDSYRKYFVSGVLPLLQISLNWFDEHELSNFCRMYHLWKHASVISPNWFEAFLWLVLSMFIYISKKCCSFSVQFVSEHIAANHITGDTIVCYCWQLCCLMFVNAHSSNCQFFWNFTVFLFEFMQEVLLSIFILLFI
jgi:predicted neutral ceramidase superfamily lipid hydrolase